MAEILLSLTIIGVVAAITLPSLTGNINERTWNTQRKALYARFSQAIALMPSLNGYGTLTEGNDSTSAVDTAAETFITEGLSKVLKINNICDADHLADCGVPDNIVTMNANSTLTSFTTNYNTLVKFNNMFNGSYSVGGNVYSYTQLDTKAAAFETANGESIIVYYNPNCVADMGETSLFYTQPKMCANFVYDLNGSKGPNTVGKDIGFMTAMYSSDPVVVAPVPTVISGGGLQYEGASQLCKTRDSESRLPNREEIVAMFVNRMLLYGVTRTGTYWSTTNIVSDGQVRVWGLNFNIGYLFINSKNATSNYYWCIKR